MAYMGDGTKTIRSFPRQANKEIVSKTKATKETCLICFDNKIYYHLMFSVDNCGHRFCLKCVKKHIEVKLLDGTTPNCPHHRCKSELSVARCGKMLTNKLTLMWKKRIKENSIPLVERIYCPHRKCSYLMSKKELISQSNNKSGRRICLKCNGSFCVHCKVPWHSMLSCHNYKKLHSFSLLDDDAKLKSLAISKKWRQCGKCQHMVERSSGCSYIKCRCGYAFCYDCGAEWYSFNHRRGNCTSYFDHDFSVCIIVMCTFTFGAAAFYGILKAFA